MAEGEVIRSVDTQAFLVTGTNVEVTAQNKFELPLLCASGSLICWSFQFPPKAASSLDIGFMATAVCKTDGSEAGERDVVLPLRRIRPNGKVIKGKFQMPGPGTVMFTWDNSYSWARSKFISYIIELNQPSSSSQTAERGASRNFSLLNCKVAVQSEQDKKVQRAQVLAQRLIERLPPDAVLPAAALAHYYRRHDPSKIPAVPDILAHYSTAELVRDLAAKYNEAPIPVSPAALTKKVDALPDDVRVTKADLEKFYRERDPSIFNEDPAIISIDKILQRSTPKELLFSLTMKYGAAPRPVLPGGGAALSQLKPRVDRFDATFESTDTSLGLAFGLVQGRFAVRAASGRSASQGVQKGDTIVAVQGKDALASVTTQKELAEMIRDAGRPLVLTFERVLRKPASPAAALPAAASASGADGANANAGTAADSNTPDPVGVTAIQSSMRRLEEQAGVPPQEEDTTPSVEVPTPEAPDCSTTAEVPSPAPLPTEADVADEATSAPPPPELTRLGFEPLFGGKPHVELVGTLTFGRCDKPPTKASVVDTGITETSVSRKQAVVRQAAGAVVVEGGGVNSVAVVRASGEEVLFVKKGQASISIAVGDTLEVDGYKRNNPLKFPTGPVARYILIQMPSKQSTQ